MSATQVLLLGTFHLANPGADLANVVVDDVLAPTRQDELTLLSESLARFQPTKVAVEAPWDDPRTQARYTAYRRGEAPLGRSETDQIGFRLAALCGHEQIYPIDVVDDFYLPGIEPLLEEPGHAATWERIEAEAQAGAAMESENLRTQTIAEALAALNTEEAREELLGPYHQLVTIAGAGNWSGPDMAANWYRRNFRIAANLHQLWVTGERVLVIYGAGHIPVLEHVLVSQGIAVVDPLPFLSA